MNQRESRLAQRPNARLIWAGLLLAAYWCALFVATHIPIGHALPGRGLDKLYHTLAYAGLAMLLATVWSLWRRPSWRSYLAVLVVIAAYGALDEWVQMHIPTRSADLLDWSADVLGGCLGLALLATVRSLLPFGRAP